MNSCSVMIHKLQQALNTKGQKILYQTSQFWSDEQNRPITMYHIRQSYYDDAVGKTKSTEIFKSASQIQVVQFLAELWEEAKDD